MGRCSSEAWPSRPGLTALPQVIFQFRQLLVENLGHGFFASFDAGVGNHRNIMKYLEIMCIYIIIYIYMFLTRTSMCK